MIIQPTGVWTVRMARNAGWDLVVPLERASFDPTLLLMRHKHDNMHWELGWARDEEPLHDPSSP